MAFQSDIYAHFGWNWDSGALDKSTLAYEKSLANGAEANQGEAVWHSKTRSLADAAIDQFDLSALTRTVFGETLTTTFERIKGILIVNLSTTGGKLIVGNAVYDCWWAPFNAADNTVDVPLDSPLLLANRVAGWAIQGLGSSSSSSSGDGASDRMLQVQASGGTVSYSIAIVGTLQAASSSSSGA